MSLLGISLLGISLLGSGVLVGLLGGWLELGVAVGTLPAGELVAGGHGFTAVAATPPGGVDDVTLGFVEGWLPTPPPVVAGVPAPTLVDELPPGVVVDEDGVAFPVAVPLLVTGGMAPGLSHGTTTAPGLPATLPALPATVGVPWVTAGVPGVT